MIGSAAALILGFVASSGSAGSSAPVFGTPVYVDQQLAGGEPEVIADTLHGGFVYTAHEGTTHLYRDGLTMSPWGDFAFVSNHCNQVNVWTSKDGINWYRARCLGTTCPTSPANNTGFSDPDLTFDAGGRLYNTGIDLANDALFSSPDGGQTWDKGTADCHDGDRPWLAGAGPNRVYMATDTVERAVVVDAGLYDRVAGVLVEPAIFQHSDGRFGVGISVSDKAVTAFTPKEAVSGTTMFAHWPAIAIDAAGTVYVVWDTDNRQPSTSGGCNGSETPAPNSIMLVYTKDLGKTWSKPIAVARPSGERVLWPWVAAGDADKVSVVWYQTEAQDNLPDLDCQTGHIHVLEATILSASSTSRSIATTDAVGRVVHVGWVCQGGTTCVAAGQDRRLGDYFTNALDASGCVLIATGDTRLTDPTTGAPYPTARPLFIRQVGGPRLIGKGNCTS